LILNELLGVEERSLYPALNRMQQDGLASSLREQLYQAVRIRPAQVLRAE
jgi:DNA-binding PadR family transcriptional regulator